MSELKRSICIFALICAVLLIFQGGRTAFVPTLGGIHSANHTVLILDAGHGGEDGGAISCTGDKESDINLSIVLKLESLMAFLGTETLLTRDRDISIHDDGCSSLREKKVSDLKNRAELVNFTPSGMLISVHQNTFTDQAYQGSQVFYSVGDISLQWAGLTQDALRGILDPNNDRKPAAVPDSVYLFCHITCPAILVECGFLSNPDEAERLLLDSYQCKIAIAIAGAYLRQLQMIPEPLGGE